MIDAATHRLLQHLVDQVEQTQAEIARIEGAWQRSRLAAAQIVDPRGDGRLYEGGYDKFTKGSEAVSTIFAPITQLEKQAGGLVLTAMARVGGDIAAGLRAGLKTLINRSIGQMHSVSEPPAGQLIDVEIDDRGTLTLKALIDDTVAAMKAAAIVYPGASISFSKLGGRIEVDNISLVDRPFEKASVGSDKVLIKVFNRKDEVMQHPVVVEYEAATEMAKRMDVDPHIAAVRLKQATDAVCVAYIKTTQQSPAAQGDRNFLQWRASR